MFCKNCGKEIDNKAVICIHCGVATEITDKPQVKKKVNGIGIAGFVVSILSVWLGVYFCIVPLIGLVLSVFGVQNKYKYNSCNGLAIAGLVIGIVTLAFWVLMWALISTFILSII